MIEAGKMMMHINIRKMYHKNSYIKDCDANVPMY